MGKKQYLLTVVLAVVAGFVGGVGSSWVLTGLPVFAQKTPTPAKVIQAEKFEVVDKDGTVRAMLGGIEDDNGPFLDLYDKDPKRRVTFQSVSGPGMSDHDGQLRARLALFLGGPYLSLIGADGKSHVEVNSVGFVIRDQNDTLRAWLNVAADGEPSLDLFDKDGTNRAWFGIRGDGEPALDLYDKKGQPRATLALDHGEPALTLCDEDEKSRAVLGHTELKIKRTGSTEQRSPASLVLMGEDGKVMWEAP